MKCAECQVIGDCKHAYGKYWSVKSHGGEGCSKPFPGWPKGWRSRIEETKVKVKVEDERENWTERFLKI